MHVVEGTIPSTAPESAMLGVKGDVGRSATPVPWSEVSAVTAVCTTCLAGGGLEIDLEGTPGAARGGPAPRAGADRPGQPRRVVPDRPRVRRVRPPGQGRRRRGLPRRARGPRPRRQRSDASARPCRGGRHPSAARPCCDAGADRHVGPSRRVDRVRPHAQRGDLRLARSLGRALRIPRRDPSGRTSRRRLSPGGSGRRG